MLHELVVVNTGAILISTINFSFYSNKKSEKRLQSVELSVVVRPPPQEDNICILKTDNEWKTPPTKNLWWLVHRSFSLSISIVLYIDSSMMKNFV